MCFRPPASDAAQGHTQLCAHVYSADFVCACSRDRHACERNVSEFRRSEFSKTCLLLCTLRGNGDVSPRLPSSPSRANSPRASKSHLSALFACALSSQPLVSLPTSTCRACAVPPRRDVHARGVHADSGERIRLRGRDTPARSPAASLKNRRRARISAALCRP